MTTSSTPPATASAPRQAEQIERQDWPTGALYLVATPIGNLGDLGPRARHALQLADVIAAEDTRTSRPLLEHWDIRTPLIAAHQHNEAEAAERIVKRLAAGERVALISDAGTPAVSDPGARIVRAVRAAGYRVVPLPGPSAVLAALMASGMTSDSLPGFAFAGFLPAKSQARQSWLREWCQLPVPVVMFESPHRLAATATDLLAVCGPEREITVARELTKRFEEVVTFPLGKLPGWLQDRGRGAQGEFVLIVAGAPAVANGPEQHDELLLGLLQHMGVRDAAQLATLATQAPRKALYQRALELQRQLEREEPLTPKHATDHGPQEENNHDQTWPPLS